VVLVELCAGSLPRRSGVAGTVAGSEGRQAYVAGRFDFPPRSAQRSVSALFLLQAHCLLEQSEHYVIKIKKKKSKEKCRLDAESEHGNSRGAFSLSR
jgi:hypothetical protein